MAWRNSLSGIGSITRCDRPGVPGRRRPAPINLPGPCLDRSFFCRSAYRAHSAFRSRSKEREGPQIVLVCFHQIKKDQLGELAPCPLQQIHKSVLRASHEDPERLNQVARGPGGRHSASGYHSAVGVQQFWRQMSASSPYHRILRTRRVAASGQDPMNRRLASTAML